MPDANQGIIDMEPSNFTDKKPGRLLKMPYGYWAFLPSPLPPKIDPSWDLMKLVSEADRNLSELAGIGRTLPNPHLLIDPFIRREAVSSSRIEGTQASLSDLFFFEALPSPKPKVGDVVEVLNYVKALEYGLNRLKTLPMSLRLIREMHEKLMHGVRGQERTPGEFRRSQNWIGPPGCTLTDATYVPPPQEEMKDALSELEKFLHQPNSLPPLVRLALIHYQFEAIHPFLDGNGRVGRLLITVLLCMEEILPKPLSYLSSFFERHRQEYYDRLLAVSQRGQWTEWIAFFLRGVTVQSKDAIKRSDQLLHLWQVYRKKVQSARSSALLLQLVEELFTYPAVTVSRAAKFLGVTHRSAQLNIDKLVSTGILKESTGKLRNRVYVAPEIIRIIEAQEAEG